MSASSGSEQCLFEHDEATHALLAVSVASAEHYQWGPGCDGWRLVDEPDLSVVEETVPVGGSEEPHVHERARQFFYLLSGTAEMRSDRGTVALSVGSGLEVPAGVAHQFVNTGETAVRFLVISAPTTRDDRHPARRTPA